MLISGDHDLILDGIHENILRLQYCDPVMQKTVSSFMTITASGCLYVLEFAFDPGYLLLHDLYCVLFTLKVKCLENLEISDITNKYIMRTQHMSLQGKKQFQPGTIEVQLKMDISHDFLFTLFSLSANNCNSNSWSGSSNRPTNY